MPRRNIPRPGVVTPQTLNAPTHVVPSQQLAPYYGGNDQMQEMLRRAQSMSDAVYPAMEDIDPEMMDRFPPVNYDAYGRPVLVEPQRMLPPDQGGQYVGPMDALLGDEVQTPSGEFVPSPTANPALLVNPQFDSRLLMAEGIEKPITDMVTDDQMIPPLTERRLPMVAAEDLGGGITRGMTTPEYTDRTLAQLRRHSQGTFSSPDEAEALLNSAMSDADVAQQQGVYMGDEYIPRSGVTLADLIALTRLPGNVQQFLPRRMNMLPSALGPAAGLAGAGGMSSDRDRPTMNANYTMGPLSGLYQ